MSKVLVVDDEKEIQEVIKDLLTTRLLYQVDTANNGLEGFIKAKENKYDLIVTDHKMPFMLGSALIVAVRYMDNLNKETPIVLLTAFISDELKASLDIDNIHFMEKPFDSEALVEYLRDLIL